MDDYSRSSGLREEWKLLLHSFLEDHSKQVDLINQVQQLSADQLKAIKKDLSQRRKKLNQAIEKIKIKIDQLSGVIENLDLVGSDSSGLLKEIDFLSREGEKISEEIQIVDEKIKKVHSLQEISSEV
jgi:methyl-accepting chemotaxis protein